MHWVLAGLAFLDGVEIVNPSPGPWRPTSRGSEIRFVDANDEDTGVWCADTAGAKDNVMLIAAAPEMREMLLKLEWAGREEAIDEMADDLHVCPACGFRKGEKFHARCEFAALLERIR